MSAGLPERRHCLLLVRCICPHSKSLYKGVWANLRNLHAPTINHSLFPRWARLLRHGRRWTVCGRSIKTKVERLPAGLDGLAVKDCAGVVDGKGEGVDLLRGYAVSLWESKRGGAQGGYIESS